MLKSYLGKGSTAVLLLALVLAVGASASPTKDKPLVVSGRQAACLVAVCADMAKARRNFSEKYFYVSEEPDSITISVEPCTPDKQVFKFGSLVYKLDKKTFKVQEIIAKK